MIRKSGEFTKCSTYILPSHIQIWLAICGSYAGFVLLCFIASQKKTSCRWPNISNIMHWSCTSWGGNLLARLAQRSLDKTNVEDFPCHDWRGHIGGKSKNSLCTLGWWHMITPLHHCTSILEMGWHHLGPSKIGLSRQGPNTLRSRSAPRIPGFHSMLALALGVYPSFHLGSWKDVMSNLVASTPCVFILQDSQSIWKFETFSHLPSLWTMDAERKQQIDIH